MRNKESWMQIGQKVLAGEQPGVITALEIRELQGRQQVLFLNVKIGKQKTSGTYSPFDVKVLHPPAEPL